MTLVYKVIVIDDQSSPGTAVEQDLTAVDGVDIQGSEFHATSSPSPARSRMRLTFPLTTADLSIRELMEVWAGFRDVETGEWAEYPVRPFGGYIIRLTEGTLAGEKWFECELVDYGRLLTHSPIISWPSSTDMNQGVLGGFTCEDWLTANISSDFPEGGVVRAVLGTGGTRFDGVDPIFSAIFFPDEVLPGLADVRTGQSSIKGQFGFTTLNEVVKVIADAALWSYSKYNTGGPELVIGYWVAARSDGGTGLVPQFCFKNMADLESTPDFIMAADADEEAGELSLLQPFEHERDATDVMQRVIVKGIGGDETVSGLPLVYFDYSNSDHLLSPSRYQVNPGWCDKVIQDNRIHTVALAADLAFYLENRLWGARGSISFKVDLPRETSVERGQRVQFRDPNEGLDRIYTVAEAEPDMSVLTTPNRYQIRLGYAQPSLDDVLHGGLPDVLMTREDLDWQLGTLSSRVYPGQVKQIPIEMAPTHPQRNSIMAQFNDTPTLRLFASAVFRPGTSDTGEALVVRQAQAFNTDGKENAWLTQPGPHPVTQAVMLIGTAISATDEVTFDWPYGVQNVHILSQSGEGTPSFFLSDGSPVTIPTTPTTAGPNWIAPDLRCVVKGVGVGTTTLTCLNITLGELGKAAP